MHNAVAKPIFGSERLCLADKLQIRLMHSTRIMPTIA